MMSCTESIRQLKAHQHHLTRQEYRTLRGQIIVGQDDEAKADLARILSRSKRIIPVETECKPVNTN